MPEVLPDWNPKRAKEVFGLSKVERLEMSAWNAAALKVALRDEASERDKHLAEQGEKEIDIEGQHRVANLEWVKALEWAILGLSHVEESHVTRHH